MDVRKIINEEVRGVFVEGNGNALKGLEIIKHPMFSSLPETRSQVDWDNRGRVFLPSINIADGRTQIFAKQDLIPHEVKGPKMTHEFAGYIGEFMEKFGSEPLFAVSDVGVEILNPYFQEWREQSNANKGAALASMGTTNEGGVTDNMVDKDTMDTPTGTLFIMNVNESKKDNTRRD